MNTSQLYSSELVLRVAVEDTPGVAASLNGKPYLPATEVTETSDVPVTIQPILTSPSERAAVAYSTDNISGGTAKTYLFAPSFVGKQIANALSGAFFSKSASWSYTDGQTIILAGITVTMSGSGTPTDYSVFVDHYLDYVANGYTSHTYGSYAFSGTLDDAFNVYGGRYSPTTTDWLFFVAKDPLSTATPPSKTGTCSGWAMTRAASSGSSTQKNLPAIYPYAVAAGLNVVFGATLGMPDVVDTLFQDAISFHSDQSTIRAKAITELKTCISLVKLWKKLPLDTALASDVSTFLTDLTALYTLEVRSYTSTKYLKDEALYAYQQLSQQIADGDYYEAIVQTQLSAGRMDREGFVRFNSKLPSGKSFTFCGLTLTGRTAGATPSRIVDAILAGSTTTYVTVSGSLTSPYSVAARRSTSEVALTKTGDILVWDAGITSATSSVLSSINVAPPIEQCFNTTDVIANLNSELNALDNTNAAISASYEDIKTSLLNTFRIAKTLLNSQKALWTAAAATGALFDDLDAYAANSSFTPENLTYTYTRMTMTDDDLSALQRITIGTQAFTELGLSKRVVTTIQGLVTSFDLACMANQPPELTLAFTGSYGGTVIEDGDVVGFTPDKLTLLPSLTGENTSFLSLVAQDSPYVDANVALQEFSLPNLAGIVATRITTAQENAYRLGTDRTNRKLSITLLEGDTTDVEAPPVWVENIGQPYKFKVQVGAQLGNIYSLEVYGILTSAKPTAIQSQIRGMQLELTVSSATLILR